MTNSGTQKARPTAQSCFKSGISTQGGSDLLDDGANETKKKNLPSQAHQV